MGSLYVVRHGQASFGQANYDALSSIGLQQATVVGQALQKRGLRFDRVLQGSMERHRETARLCLLEMPGQAAVETADWLNEFDHQAVMRALHPDFADTAKVRAFMLAQKDPAKAFHKEFEKAMRRWMENQHPGDYPESFPEFKQRCERGLKNLLASADSRHNLLLFTSGGPISCLMQIALELSDAMFLQLNGAIVNASLSRFPFKDSQLFLAFFNDAAHFDQPGSPLLTHR